MKINRKQLLNLYNERINIISDHLDWKTAFTKEEIVDIICDILQENPDLIDLK